MVGEAPSLYVCTGPGREGGTLPGFGYTTSSR